MNKLKYLTPVEVEAVAALSRGLATYFMRLKLDSEGDRVPEINFILKRNGIYCSLRVSKTGALWFNSATRLTTHNCVSSDPVSKAGAIIAARFDATDFIAWLTEELEETLIRYKIIRNIKKTVAISVPLIRVGEDFTPSSVLGANLPAGLARMITENQPG